uniref:Rieske domain-containing protein n=1 Tax=Macrostomum lignano TaxID=282301 RepID=A0A1I8IH85_9PLAT
MWPESLPIGKAVLQWFDLPQILLQMSLMPGATGRENAAMLDNKIFCPIHFFELHEQLKATSSKVVNGDFDCQRPPTTDRIRSVSC